ncbi:hypothetical protein [Nesterenkonia massiliensis]|uniref:hypothetical protein n=1 Tax=Nesterenkonia massiliensis TaxID=1232429 RepID=UPI0003F58A69|nr:hypothetical protein [Nesterenkonia massiliensis]
MQTEALIQPRKPVSGIHISSPESGTVYLLPASQDRDGKHAYRGADAILIKQAMRDGLAVEYAVPEEDREFVEHFSSGLEVVTLTVAVLGLVPSTIQGIYALIQLAARRKGVTEENLNTTQVHLEIDYIKTPTTVAQGVKISGDPHSVLEAMKKLNPEP